MGTGLVLYPLRSMVWCRLVWCGISYVTWSGADWSGSIRYVYGLVWTGLVGSVICLFDLILYVPSTIFQLYRDGSSWVEPVLS